MPSIKKYLVIWLLAVSAFLPGCQVGTIGTWQNQNINADIRTELSGLNRDLFKRIMDKDVNGVKQMMSFELIQASGDKVDSIVTTIGGAFHAKDYRLLDEYYTQTLIGNVDVTLASNRGNPNDYEIKYHANNREMYAALMVSKNLPVNCLVLAIYGKHDDGWKLNILQIGQYEVYGKTAPECYAEAQNQYKKQNWINSSDYIVFASELSKPATTYFTYKNDDQMSLFYEKVLREANGFYGFPITVSKVPTQPVIRSIRPDFFTDKDAKHIFPVINYTSSIAIKDTVALKAENENLQKVIGTIFNGIKQDNEYIVYHVYNQKSGGTVSENSYGFIQKLK